MKKFMDKNFLLDNETSIKLFHEYADTMPIIDYHCHINPKEIALDITFDNITQVWLGGDHYKWRYMRSCGVEEKYITGDASDKEKFLAWAKCLGKAIGNPLFHWSHLELQRYFDYHGVLNEKTAEKVWTLCNEKLAKSSFSSKELIKKSNVKVICTTDDPIDSLEWHQMIKKDTSFDTLVLPTFRPDKAMNIEKPDYLSYLTKLEEVTKIKIDKFNDLKKAIKNRLDYFVANGCKISDHGLDYVMCNQADDSTIELIFQKRKNNTTLSHEEILQFKTSFLAYVCSEYKKNNMTLQLHYGCKRDNNTSMYKKIGADTGFDCIDNYTPIASLSNFLDMLDKDDNLPKTILYSLNPIDNAAIDSLIGCFQNESAISKIQHGSAWWFNDNKTGMIDQLTSLANLGNLSGFVGMLTDSRSFLSYTRHEYFRRILCNLIGTWVENGEFPDDYDILSEIVQDISYNNAKRYFGFEV